MKYGVIGLVGFVAASILSVRCQAYNYHGVSYLSDGLNGWVACLDPYPPVIHTSDGWQTVKEQATGTTYKMWDIYFLNDTLGWTAGLLGEIRVTTDGGNTWTQQTVGDTKYFTRIYFVDDRHGWAAGGDAILDRTTNGGATWESIFLPIGHTDCYGVFFIDSLNGWIASRTAAEDTGECIDTSAIFRTGNGGSYWVPQFIHSDTLYDFGDVYFANINEGWVVGGHRHTYEPLVLHSTNGGATWNPQSVSVGAYLRSVDFVSNKIGWAVGKFGTIIHTKDGGSSWEQQTSGVTVTLFDVDFIDSLRGVAVGDSSTILITHNGGAQWERAGIEEKSKIKNQKLEIYPNPFTQKTVISYWVRESQEVEIKIYSLAGRLVRILPIPKPQSLPTKVIWDGTDESGIEVKNGIYFLKLGLPTGQESSGTKLIKIK